MAYIENIIIGTPIVDPKDMFASDEDDWTRLEEEKTYYTEERFLPKILVELGIYPSINEIRRNKQNLMISLDKLDFVDNLKVSKKRRMCIGLTGCSGAVSNGDRNFICVDNEYIHLITVCDRDDGNVIAYDEDTKVLYLCVYGYSTMGITPIYNSDGSLKLYEE